MERYKEREREREIEQERERARESERERERERERGRERDGKRRRIETPRRGIVITKKYKQEMESLPKRKNRSYGPGNTRGRTREMIERGREKS